MNAEILRRAAALMRERAEAATPGPWLRGVDRGRAYLVESLFVRDGDEVPVWQVVAEVRGRQTDSQHIASWHPAVALAVADWLDATARELDALGDPDLDSHPLDGRRTAALAVARAYLGETA